MPDIDIIKQMPYSLEAEQALLGAIIIDPALLNEAVTLRADDFYIEHHKLIYNALKDLFSLNKNIDIVTLINYINNSPKDSDFDNARYIKTLCELGAACTNITDYIEIIKDKALLRSLIDASRNISDKAFNDGGDAKRVVEYAEQQIYDLAGDNINNGFVKIDEIIVDNYKEFQRIMQNPDQAEGVKTGYSELDNYFVSLGAGDLVIVGARPGVGKTTFCMNIAANIGKAYKDGDVAIFSLEMSKESLVNRMLSAEANVDNYTIRRASFSTPEWEAITMACSTLSNTRIYIDDTPSTTTTDMKAKLRRLDNPKIVIIDYLQLIECDKYSDNKVLQVAEITRSLKLIAKEMKIPIILCSQLSRPNKNVKEKRPMLSDLRDSGAIEQDADIVMLLYRDDYYDNSGNADQDPTKQQEIECIIGKNRHGATGTVKFAWHGQYFKYVAIEEGHDEPAGH